MTQASTKDEPLRRPYLDLAAARRIAEAAEAEARKRDLALSIAVVDETGLLVHFLRMDEIHAGTVAVAQAKARTAALYRRSTAAFAEALAAGGSGLLALPDMVPLPGGATLERERRCVGGVGISGATPEIDGEVAATAAAAFGGDGP